MTQTPHKARAMILVVDDDTDILETIRGNLELDGYEVLCAQNGRDGIDLAKNHHPDLIVLDLNLPDIDGIKACQIIRREFDFPIVILTARDGISDKVLGLECGADDYMVKPFNFLELSARIKAILKRVERDLVKNYYENKDLRVDFKARKVFVRGDEIKLTRTEFELLELFISYPGEVLSRDYITRQIWRDSELYQHSRALDVHVQRLRKKMESNMENPQYIVTVAGVGYGFNAG